MPLEALSDAETVTSENLTAFQARRMGLDEVKPDAAPAAPAASPAPAAAPEPSPAPPPAEASDGSPAPAPEEHPARRPKIEQRFSELTQQRDAERARAEAAERRLADAEAKLTTAPKPAEVAANDPNAAPAKPKPESFTDAFEYAEKLAEWSTSEALRKRDESDRKAASERSAAEVRQAWVKRAAEVEKEHPDFKEVLASATDLAVSDQVRDALMESDHGPRILYELAQDADLVDRLGKMTISAAVRTIGRMEAKYEKTAPVAAEALAPALARKRLPEPIAPIRAVSSDSAEGKIDAAGNFTGTYEEFVALSNAGKIK